MQCVITTSGQMWDLSPHVLWFLIQVVNSAFKFFFIYTWYQLPFSSFWFPPFGIEYLFYACPTTAFQKHLTCSISEAYGWKTICLEINHILRLMHIWFSWYLDENLDCRLLSWYWNRVRLWELTGRNKYILHMRRTYILWIQGWNSMVWIFVTLKN